MFQPLRFEYDDTIDLMTIEGIKYSGSFFRAFAEDGLAIGAHLKIIKRHDGVITFETIYDADDLATASAG